MQEESETESLTTLARDANFQAFVLHGSMLHLYALKAQLPLLGIIAGMPLTFHLHVDRHMFYTLAHFYMCFMTDIRTSLSQGQGVQKKAKRCGI